MDKLQADIFKRGSKTFFYSTLFFPREIKRDVAALYAFVRVADDFVDSTPPRSQSFKDFVAMYEKALAGGSVVDSVISSFVLLKKEKNIPDAWVSEFLGAMQSDLAPTACQSLADTEKYMYGSAGVVGLMMCQILGVAPVAHPFALKLGEAFQYINFIRDLQEDEKLGRSYLPVQHFISFGLPTLDGKTALANKDNFEKFLRTELDHFFLLINQAKVGFDYIPTRYRLPILIATRLYLWTARVIYRQPLVVFAKKVKPSKLRILLEAMSVLLNTQSYKYAKKDSSTKE